MISNSLPEKQIRKEICINGLWDFKCDVDKEWTTIKVPSCYSTQSDGGKWDRFYWDTFGYPKEWYKQGASYKRKLRIPDEMKEMNLYFVCNGCFYHSETFINGNKVGEFHEGYFPFEFEINNASNTEENLIEVRVGAQTGYTSGGESMDDRGIWQDVYLRAYPDVYTLSDFWVSTSVEKNIISCEIPIKNCSDTTRKIFIRNFVTDQEGKIVKIFDGGWKTINPNEEAVFNCSASWEDPHLWFPHDPYLYNIHTVIYDENEEPLDWKTTRFGFREITWKGPHLYLNGRELFLRGDGGHYCGDLQGTKEYAVQWFKSLKELGVNFARLHVYPKHSALYEAADEVGFMLEAEAAYHFRVTEDENLAKEHVGRLIKNERNHPSVIMWSVSNELRWRGGGEKKYLIDHARSIDNTRPVFASDFSGWSVHGDVIGHHYNAKTVFEEWEQFGPDKPMIWDELGNVWQPDRPLRNGTAGYEVTSQDYATGLWRDGHDDMLADIEGMINGKYFNGELNRVNGYVPWDLSYCFFRFQPTNNHRVLELNWPSLERPGVKQNFIKPCASTVNIWDKTLPVFEPNPGFYFFEKYLRAVRFFDKENNFTFFSGDEVKRTSRLVYEDLRLVDEISCRVETKEGEVLWEKRVPYNIKPGEIVENIELYFQLPVVDHAKEINLVRQFFYNGECGYKDTINIKVFPRFNAALVSKLSNFKLGVVDEAGLVQKLLKEAGVAFREVGIYNLILAEKENIDVLIINAKAAAMIGELGSFIEKGGRVLYIAQGTTEILNDLGASARIPLNGAKHRLLDSLTQENFTYWREGAVSGALQRASREVNFRVVLAGDKDGRTSALHEEIIGKGVAVVTSLKILESLNSEPAAAWMLRNMLTYLAKYRVDNKTVRTAVLASNRINTSLKASGLIMDEIAVNNISAINNYPVTIIDASDKELTKRIDVKEFKAVLKAYTGKGGKVLIYHIIPETISFFREVIGKEVALTEPYLLENRHCVKAATSWTRRDTPKDLIEYYDGILIPQPFEPNYDPLLTGISNCDLYWDGEPMFERGIEIKGMDPVYATKEYNILISNWRIDWSQPKYGGEYIQESKDIRRADWFINRDHVLLRINQDAGALFICQLEIFESDKTSSELVRQLLTGIGCSIGKETAFPPADVTFDLSFREDQLKRFKELSNEKPACRLKYGLDGEENSSNSGDGASLPKILIIGDSSAKGYFNTVSKDLEGWAEVYLAGAELGSVKLSSREVLKNIYSLISGARWQVIYFNYGLEDLKRYGKSGDGEPAFLDSKGESVVTLKEFANNTKEIVKVLKSTGAKLFWGSITPISEKTAGYHKGDEVEYNFAAKKVMEANGVYINDIYNHVITEMVEYEKSESLQFTTEQFELLGHQVASAIRYFGE